MYTDEQLEELEAEERTITDEAIAVMLLILSKLASDLENELRKFYQEYGTDGVVTYSEARKWVDNNDHRRRLFVLLLTMDEYMMSARDEIKTEFEKMLRQVVELEGDFFDADLDIDKIIESKWGADESTWDERLDNDFEHYEAKLYSELKTGMVREHSVGDVLLDVDDVFGTQSRSLERLVITESTALGSFARKAIMRGRGVKRYQFYAMEDERTCEHCGALHGKVFPIAQFEVGVTASPIHPRCRCFEVPIID